MLGGASIMDTLTLFSDSGLAEATGSSYASSEWAKLTFNYTLFGGKSKIKVPYTRRSSRLPEIYSVLGINETDTNTQDLGTPENPKPISSGQAGMMSDYIFRFSDEQYQQLANTHEVVVLTDVSGSRPGSGNEILLLAPTSEALSSGENIPMPDNRIITRSGQLIDRGDQDAQSADGVDNIVSTAQAAIDRADAGIGTSTGQSSAPVQPVGRMSSSRPRGVQGSVRPGDETNALDAFAADATP